MSDNLGREAVAIVGIGCRFPGGANSPAAFWNLLCAGVDTIRELPPDRFDLAALYDSDPAAVGKLYSRWGGFIDGIDEFDADFFGIAPREARRMDPQQRLLLEVVWEALEHGGQPPELLAGTNAGVFIGISSHDYTDVQDFAHHRDYIDAHVNAGGATCIAANRISYLLDLRGPSFAVDTACSSSLTAVHLACRSLASGECDVAIAGGVNVLLSPEVTIGFCRATMLSPDGRCHTFDARANGYVRGEGAGAVVLKPLERALADGDPIHAVIRGSAINQDGRTPGISLPSVAGQEQMLRQALRAAGVPPAAIQYVEAHGTGTRAGDPVEAEAIGRVFSRGRRPGDRCVVGSVKTNVGHLEAGSGIAGLIKATLALGHRKIPPSLHFVEPNPAIPFDELQLRVPTALEPWPETDGPAMAGVNSFGFGGANAHVVLEETPPIAPTRRASDVGVAHALLLSARSADALRDVASRFAAHLASDDGVSLHDVCYTAALRRSHHEHRLAAIAASRADLRELLDAFHPGEECTGLATARSSRNRPPRLAFVFTGMGPQWWQMGRQLLREQELFRTAIREVDALLRPLAGWSLLDELMADEATSRVTDADVAHIANFAIQFGLAALWRSWGIVPDAVVGHSSGEMAAACVAGALTLPDAVRLAYHRGRLQHRTTGTGRMLAAGISTVEAARLIAGLEDRVSIAAVNSPASVTLSGEAATLERLAKTLAAEQRFCRFLAVDVPYHGPQMEQIREALMAELAELQPVPVTIPLISEVTGKHAAGPELDAAYWWRNVREPVRFSTAIDQLSEDGFELFVEIGPHPVLAASIAECCAQHGRNATVLPSLRRGDDERRVLLNSLAALHVRGRPVQWSSVYPSGVCVSLPTYPWQRERHWFETTADEPQSVRSAGTDGGHALLGRRLRAPLAVWEAELNDSRLAYLEDHVVQDNVVFPGAGYVEQVLAAAQQSWGDGPVTAERLVFRKLLFDPRASFIQLRHDPDRANVEIHAAPRAEDASWTLHATAVLKPLALPLNGAVADLGELRHRCVSSADVAALYGAFERRGLRYGPAFRGIRELWLGDGEALGRLALASAEVTSASTYRVHPALLDAAFQVLGSSGPAHDDALEGTLVPISIARIECFGQVGAVCWAHAVVKRGAGALEGDVRLLDDTGRVLLHCHGVRLHALSGTAARVGITDWLYEMHWDEVPLQRRSEHSAALPAPSSIVAATREATQPPDHAAAIGAHYDVVEPALNRIALHFVRAALRTLGWTNDLASTDPGALAEALGVIPRYRRFFERLLQIAGSETGAKEAGDFVPENLAHLVLADHPDQDAEFELLIRCGSRLAEILRGTADGRDILFGDSLQALSRLYARSPISRYYNELTAAALAVAAGRRHPHDAPLRLLEIGAGTGGLTSAVLPRLQPGTVDYLFTDVSTYFLNGAKETFSHRSDVRFGRLDIETDPTAQQFTPGSFDVVIGANVVHATTDIRDALRNLRRLLAPGGLLLLVEITRRAYWFDLIFGLLDGWWRFADHDLRSHPLLLQEQWAAPLRDAGFEDIQFLADPPQPGGTMESLLLARAPRATDAPAARRWVIFADRTGVSERVAAAIRERGDHCVLIHHGDAVGRVSTHHFAIEPTPDDVRRVLELLHAEGPLQRIVHLWSLDARPADHSTSAQIMSAQLLGCESVLHVIHALERVNSLPELWFVTSGSQLMDGEAVAGVAQAPVWGLARVLRNEQPALHPRLLDLSPQPSGEEIDCLVEELYANEFAAEVGLRGGGRWVRRLRHAAAARAQPQERAVPVTPDETPFSLEVGTPGALDTLRLRAAQPLSPAAGQVLIRVLAAGLNFRDVLLALGVLPPTIEETGSRAGTLTIECAGVVIRCGPDVAAFRPGDEVIALAVGALGSHATARVELVVHKPPHLSFEDGASIAGAFLTAQYGLVSLARIQAGERVLVHAATGGVGHAALQLCQRAGAEIFATAGTPEKRAYLRSLGIEHVMDSRSLAWADEVLERTSGAGVDVVLNSLAGDAIRKGLDVLRPFGRFVEIGKRDIYEDTEVGLLPFRKNIAFFSVDLVRLCLERPAEAGAMLRDLIGQIADGRLELLPRTDSDVSEAEQAFRLMAAARHMGKVVLTVTRPEYAVLPLAESALFRADATYLITGGLGGFGLAIAEWMVSRGARHLVLTSRSGVPKDNEQALRRLERSDATVRVVRADVASEDDVVRMLADIATGMPPLRGVMHLAMVLDDALLGQLDSGRFRTVMRPKIAGAWNLHRLTEALPLDHFVLFSSISSVIGHALQGNYAAANTFLDSLAAYRCARGLPGVAISWGTIADVGYVSRHTAIQQHLTRLGILSFTPDQALEALEHALRHEAPHLVAARLDWSILQKWNDTPTALGGSRNGAEQESAAPAPAGAGASLLTRLHGGSSAERAGLLEAHLILRAAKVLGTTAQRLDPERPLTEMGLDSLLAVELLTAIKLDVGVQIPVVSLLQGISIRELMHTVLTQLGLDQPERSPPITRTVDVPSNESPTISALSFEQRRFWFQEQLESGNPAYHLFAAARLLGPLEVHALQRSLDELVRRHDVLRARFTEEDGEPVQTFGPPVPVPLTAHDLRTVYGDRETELHRLTTAEIRRPFDLSKPPLLRGMIVRVAEDEHTVLLVVHHIAADAWAMTLLVREVMTLYGAFVRGASAPLPPPTARYADYVTAQQQALREDVAAPQLEYWQQQLAGASGVLRLPGTGNHARPVHAGARIHFEWSLELSDALRDLSRREGVTLFTTLLAAFQTLLHRYSGDTDISLGTPVSTRSRSGDEELVGCCMNTLVLRSDLAGDPPFRTQLQRVRETTLGALAHQDLPFERVVEALQPQRDGHRTPLFEAMLILHNLRWPELTMEHLVVQPLEVESGAAVCDVTLLVDTGERLHGALEYNTDRFDAALMARMLDHLRALLHSIVRDPEQPLSTLSLLTDAERQALVGDGSEADVAIESRCLHELLAVQVERTPDSVAIETAVEQLSYRELDRRSNVLAQQLVALGVGPDFVVGLCAGPCTEAVVAFWGILKAGGAYLPLDPASPRQRLDFMLRDAAAPVLLTLRQLERALPEYDGHVLRLDELEFDGDATLANRSGPADLAYVMFTSGSTGEPKGVLVPHCAIHNQVQARQATVPLARDDVVLQSTPLSFDPSVWELAGPLAAGARLVLPAASEERDSASLMRLVVQHQVTVLQIVPSLLSVLLDEPGIDACRSLRVVLCGGESLTPRLRDRFFERLPQVELYNLYGPTETAIDATCWRCRENRTAAVVPIGRPIDNVQVYLLDAHQQPVPPGVAGELCIGGAGVARGYLNRPELTAEKFIPHPFGAADARLYRTGDLARRLSSGTIEFLGRADDQVKIRGQRVEPGEIAGVLSRHPAVREAAVVAVEDAVGERRLVAYVVGADSNGDALRIYLSERLPSHMVPCHYAFVPSLPKLSNGKLDVRALAAATEVVAPQRRTYLPPRDAVELKLVQIWEEFLEAYPIGVTENFFDLGGHSLMAMRLIARVRQSFGREVPLSSLVDGGTIAHLASLLRSSITSQDGTTIVALQNRGSAPPYFWVHPTSGSVLCYMDLARALGEYRPCYGIQSPALDGRVEPLASVEEMAAAYVAELRAIQRDGPYYLGGWSMGSAVAYEIACQLSAQGQRVAQLVLIDPPSAAADATGDEDVAVRLELFAESVGLSSALIDAQSNGSAPRSAEQLLAQLLEQAQSAGVVPADLHLTDLQRSFHLHSAHLAALRRYRPRRFAGNLTIVYASAGSRTPQRNDGWAQLVEGDVVLHMMPGDHYSILREPIVRSIARQIVTMPENSLPVPAL